MSVYSEAKRLRQAFIEKNLKEPDRLIMSQTDHDKLCEEFRSIGRGNCSLVTSVQGMEVRVCNYELPHVMEVR